MLKGCCFTNATNISETTSIDWGGDKMNPVQMAAAGIAMDAINNLGKLDIGKAVEISSVSTKMKLQKH